MLMFKLSGKMPTTSVRRLISPLTRSIGLVTGMKIAVPTGSVGIGWFRRMVRPSGTRGAGSTKSGQADVFDELRARA
jgi:hypothetical protein